ncbi:MAG: TRAP transporter substrate-binding protein [Gammaproteobacteria bacterium]|nr:TRAP transporter substrate-binding protein [Gammaproteobacteria bacterium]MCY4166044.1 TRAP transporter substrate-binding protein [Gammaproteobacteria bacterium]MCY4254690.1 TRAP transporter substrate-binding protein [Gammaproteobacteria bacterium]
MKRRLVLAAAGFLALAACGPSDDAGRQADEAPEVTEITAAGTAVPNTIGEQHWLTFQRKVEEGSQGRFRVRMLVHGQFSEEQIAAGLQRGRVQIGNLSAMMASTLVPETAMLYAPFLFDSEEQADFIYDHYLTGLFASLLAEQGLHLVSWSEIGFHHIYSVTPVLSPADMRGRRYRVSASEASRLFGDALGADVIPLGFGEIVPSLQTGLIESGENSLSLYVRTGTPGEAPHLTLTAHSFGMSVIVAGKAWWDGLADSDREIIALAYPSIAETRKDTREEAARDLENAQSFGIQPRWPDPVERDRWAASVAHVPEALARAVGGQSGLVLETIAEGKAAFARQAASQ